MDMEDFIPAGQQRCPLMFIRERPEEAADIAMKKIPMGNVSRPLVVEGIRRFSKAFPDGVPGLPSQQGIKTLMDLT
jgi:hypothetical protein